MKKKMSRTLAAMVALSLSGVAAAWSQMTPSTQSQPAAMEKPAVQSAAPETKEIHGTIKSVDRTKMTLTLEDGTTLAVPASVMVAPDSLKKGAQIRARYEEQGSQKVVTSLHVETPSKS